MEPLILSNHVDALWPTDGDLAAPTLKIFLNGGAPSYFLRWKALACLYSFYAGARGTYDVVTGPNGRSFLVVYKHVPHQEAYESFFAYFCRAWTCLPKKYTTGDPLSLISRASKVLEAIGLLKLPLKDIREDELPKCFEANGSLRKVRQPGACLFFRIQHAALANPQDMLAEFPYLNRFMTFVQRFGLEGVPLEGVPMDEVTVAQREEAEAGMLSEAQYQAALAPLEMEGDWGDFEYFPPLMDNGPKEGEPEVVLEPQLETLYEELVSGNANLWNGVSLFYRRQLFYDVMAFLDPGNVPRRMF